MTDTYRFETLLDTFRASTREFKAHLSNLEAPDIEWMDEGLRNMVREAVYSRALELVKSSGFRNAAETFRGMLLMEARKLGTFGTPMHEIYRTLRVESISKVIGDLEWCASVEEANGNP